MKNVMLLLFSLCTVLTSGQYSFFANDNPSRLHYYDHQNAQYALKDLRFTKLSAKYDSIHGVCILELGVCSYIGDTNYFGVGRHLINFMDSSCMVGELRQINQNDIKMFEFTESTNLNVAVIVIKDCSGSIPEANLIEIENALDDLLSNPDNFEYSLYQVSNNVTQKSRMSRDRNELRKKNRRNGNQNESGGYSPINDALLKGIRYGAQLRGYDRVLIICITDGYENTSSSTAQDVISASQASGIPLFFIGYKDIINEIYLKELADASRGAYYMANSRRDMKKIFSEIFERMTVVNHYNYRIEVPMGRICGPHKLLFDLKIPGLNAINQMVKITGTPDCLIKRVEEDIKVEAKKTVFHAYKFIRINDTLLLLPDTITIIDSIKVNSTTMVYQVTVIIDPVYIPIPCTSSGEGNMVIYYSSDHYELTREMKILIDQWIPALRMILNKDPNIMILVSGHTDRHLRSKNRGGNEWLSLARAEELAKYLIRQGIDPGRIRIAACSSGSPWVITELDNYLYNLPIKQELNPAFISTLPEASQREADKKNRRSDIKLISTVTPK